MMDMIRIERMFEQMKGDEFYRNNGKFYWAYGSRDDDIGSIGSIHFI